MEAANNEARITPIPKPTPAIQTRRLSQNLKCCMIS